MKNLFLIIVTALLPIFSFSQTYCSYSGGGCANGLQYPTEYAANVVQSICNVLNVRYIETYAGNVGNACASNHQGRPIITYNAEFLNYLYSHNTWAPISVMAHEVGHHINNDISWYGAFQHSWTKELRADFVSGYALYHLGCPLEDAKSAFYIMFSWMGTSSHPDTPRRIAALTQGYRRAQYGY